MLKSLTTGLATLLALAPFTPAFAGNPGELTQNGDLETGDTSGWQYFPTASSTFNATNQSNGGSFAAELSNTAAASGAVVKQANVGLGVVKPGDTIYVSFAAKGNGTGGGVAFAELFSEISGGGTSSSEILGGGPLNLTSEWQTYCFAATAGPNVSGGISLQFAAVTGGLSPSSSTLSIDDVSLSTGEMTVNGDFELGDETGWQYFPSSFSSFNATSFQPNSGTWCADLFNPNPNSLATIKQANLGVGVVQPGDTIEISFSARITETAGVGVAEFLCESSGGPPSSVEVLGGGPLPLTGGWQAFSFTTTAGPDVSGGVSVQFTADTGFDASSFVSLFVDDVSVKAAVGGGSANYCSAGINNDGEMCTMSFTGAASLSANNLELVASGVSSLSTAGLFIMSDARASIPFASGTLCVATGGQFSRLNPAVTYSNQDVVTRPLDTMSGPGSNINAGETWNFQFWYRDAGSTNLSDGISICFLP